MFDCSLASRSKFFADAVACSRCYGKYFERIKEGSVLEFGVYKGTSLKRLQKFVGERSLYGFDSFLGLPDDWFGDLGLFRERGYFNLDGKKPPQVEELEQSGAIIIPGMFNDTIPKWLEYHDDDIALIHVDCDVYSSTRDVLFGLNNRITAGCIVVFDEILGIGSEENEWKAFCEWVNECDRVTRAFTTSDRDASVIVG